jgi:hypothetical protein
MRRRDFIKVVAGSAMTLPLAAHAQQGDLPLIGVLRPNPKDVGESFAEPFRRYMKAIGWEEGRNVRFLFVWMEARNEREPVLAGELVAHNVNLIIPFGDPAIGAVQRATQISPEVDQDRYYLLQDLIMTGEVSRFGFVRGVGASTAADPRTNLTGDPYVTDGLRLVVFLGAQRRPFNEIEFLEWERSPP